MEIPRRRRMPLGGLGGWVHGVIRFDSPRSSRPGRRDADAQSWGDVWRIARKIFAVSLSDAWNQRVATVFLFHACFSNSNSFLFLTMKIITTSTEPPPAYRAYTKRLTPALRALNGGQSDIADRRTAQAVIQFHRYHGKRCTCRRLPDGQTQVWIFKMRARNRRENT